MSIITRIKDLFEKKSTQLVLVLFVVSMVVTALMPEISFAQAATPAVTNEPSALSLWLEGLNSLSTFFSVILYFLNFLIWPILVLIGALLDNNLIFGGGMEDYLLTIWAQIRNLVNLLFVVALVGIALYNVVALDNEGNYVIKQIMPKFILALVLVNFSFFGAKVALDAANVATVAVFSLPTTVQEELGVAQNNVLAQDICSSNSFKGVSAKNEFGAIDGAQIADKICATDNSYTEQARAFFGSFSKDNVAMVMAMQFGKIHKLLDPSEFARQNPSLQSLTINLLFAAAMYVLYIAAFVSLLLVLIARLVALWAIIALSPFAALKVILPEGVGAEDFDGVEIFTKHIIAPIKIAFGLSIGYIMLSAMQQVGPTSLGLEIGEQFATPFPGLSSLQEIIIAATTVGVVYKVSLNAAEGTFAADLVNGVKGFIDGQVDWLKRLPMVAPIIPTTRTDAKTGGVSGVGLLNGLRGVQSKLETAGYLEEPKKKSEKHFTDLNSFVNESKNITEDRNRIRRWLSAFANLDKNSELDTKARSELKVENLYNVLSKQFKPEEATAILKRVNIDPEADKAKRLSDISDRTLQDLRIAIRKDSKFKELYDKDEAVEETQN